jgi:arylsulfatase A-like enzyme
MEAAGLPFPKSVNGTAQLPFDGTSMIYSFDNANAKETHTTQYFEMFGKRGIYHDGWVAAARHSIPWLLAANNPPLSQDTWEMYHVADDFSEAKDLATQDPAKLKELQALFMAEAVKNHVLPIDDRRAECSAGVGQSYDGKRSSIQPAHRLKRCG